MRQPGDCTPYEKGKCWACGDPLSGRQTHYCSPFCSETYYANHYWQGARAAAILRDKHRCVRCGASGTWKMWHEYLWLKQPLEVNHIIPIMGNHKHNGCHHHLEGLETLCHDCHLDETNRQFKRGKYKMV